MLDEILADLIENERMAIKKAIIDRDASCHEIILTLSLETKIVFCGNHIELHSENVPYGLGTSEKNSLSGECT